jgi:hypothetical protein
MDLVLYLSQPPVSIFSFANFISALALLIIMYTLVDIRYRFRIAIARLPLINISLIHLSFGVIILIGFGTLITDYWFPEIIWIQLAFAALFLFFIICWIYYAFINPPIFCKRNYSIFLKTLYHLIIKGSNNEMTIIADELERSVDSIIKLTYDKKSKNQRKNINNSKMSDCAHELLLLIGNRKLCYHIISSSPGTAVSIFEALKNREIYPRQIGAFASNIATEALINKESILYHEDIGYKSNLLGYVKSFSQSIFGNYQLIETITIKYNSSLIIEENFSGYQGSPLDIDSKLIYSWDNEQLETYCRCVTITWESYILSNDYGKYSHSLFRAFEYIRDSVTEPFGYRKNFKNLCADDIRERFLIISNFFRYIIDFLDKNKKSKEVIRPFKQMKDIFNKNKDEYKTIYDLLAENMFIIIVSASRIKYPTNTFLEIQNYSVGENFFFYLSGDTWKIIYYKLRRLLYNEIKKIKKDPNYDSARILGFCLNVMGLEISDPGFNASFYALHKVIIKWAINNYLFLRKKHLKIAEACLVGKISFDEDNFRLVETFERGSREEAFKQYLYLRNCVNNEKGTGQQFGGTTK